MIVVRLIGGLGNQLFQYAAGRRLAHRHGTVLKLDATAFEESYKLHRYSLGALAIQERFATREEIARFEVPRWTRRFARLLRGVPFAGKRLRARALRVAARRRSLVEERFLEFDPEILDLPDGVCLSGYWASWKYFADAEPILRGELVVKSEQRGRDREVAAEIAAAESVCVHVRRADFVQLGTAMGPDYYLRAVDEMKRRVGSPRLFVFSDDPEWCAKNLRLDAPTTIVAHNTAATNFEDLRLMSQCRHHIIANSTFSWWAAWLGASPVQVVFAPERLISPQVWSRHPHMEGWRGEAVERDFYPPAWNLVPNEFVEPAADATRAG